ncbi:MAG: hypothetical protein ACYS21_16400 [Planctomycetota bacterium]
MKYARELGGSPCVSGNWDFGGDGIRAVLEKVVKAGGGSGGLTLLNFALSLYR